MQKEQSLDSQQEPGKPGASVAEGAKAEQESGVVDSGEDLAAELEKVRAEKEELRDRMLRAAADFENMKKRVQREKEISLKYAEENLLREILPSLDNLERALLQDRNAPEFAGNLLSGVELTLKGMVTTLEKYGLCPIESVGKAFDPNFHEAMALEASKEIPEQNIVQEYEKGYMFKDRLLRAAKVVVSKGDV